MPSSEDSNTPRSNTWTLDEFGDLVTAWELATSQPRDASAPTLHDAVFKHFAALRGGTTRRNKAALTSKRSALKFTYLYIRDFDSEQKAKNLAPFFNLTPLERAEILSGWKKVNSSLVELTPEMYQGLMRIVSKGGDDDPVVPIRKRQKELQEATSTTRMETRPTRASTTSQESSPTRNNVVAKKKHAASVRTSSHPWSMDETLQLLDAWTRAATTVCESSSTEPLSIVHELYHEFEKMQGGPMVRNVSGLATRRRVLKQSYARIAAFDQVQARNGDAKFTDLPVVTRLNVLRSWKNVNLLDLPRAIYAKLHTMIALDTQAVAREDLRRKRAGGKALTVVAGRNGSRSFKKQKGKIGGVEDDHDSARSSSHLLSVGERGDVPKVTSLSGPASKTDETAPASVTQTDKLLAGPMIDQSASNDRNTIDQSKRDGVDAPSANDRENVSIVAQEQGPGKSVAAASVRALATDEALLLGKEVLHQDPETDTSTLPPLVSQGHDTSITTVDTRAVEMSASTMGARDDRPVDSVVFKPNEVDDCDAPWRKGTGRWGKRKRKMHADAPNGLLWDTNELDVLIQAWEKAAMLVCHSEPTERRSLNREMYREFVAMQGGYSVRNDTALAARRSSLKSSHAYILSFNESQKAKGEPCYHDLPQDTRMDLLRSWKNRNSVDLTREMYEALGRIIAMDAKLAEIRHLRPMKVKSGTSVFEPSPFPSEGDVKSGKALKWSTEESSDLIKACADVMNVPTDHEMSQTDRGSHIFDAFLVRRQRGGDVETPVRRDLRSMAQQWRCILASYSYIKACNDDRSRPESPSWFDMTASQKRAYQQCTNVPVKFVDLDAEMFALVTKTSFVGVASPLLSPTLPLSGADVAADGIALRPRSARKKAEVFWSSGSESSVAEESVEGSRNDRVFSGKKGKNWPANEIWTLIQAWEEAAETTKGTRLTSALHEAYALFIKRQGPFHRTRTLVSVKNRMIALNSSFLGISAYVAKRGDSSSWFNLTSEERMNEIRSWGNKTIIDLNETMYKSLARILDRKPEGRPRATKRTQRRSKELESKSPSARPEKYAAANWSKAELLMLSEACGELLEGRRSRRYVFEEEKDRFYRRYEELGGSNSLVAAVGLARYVLDSYEFIYFYNQRATETGCFTWFELDLEDRESITTTMSKSYRSFNGLTTVNEELYEVIDKLDAALRVRLGEDKKKTYQPPTDATSSRYVNIESVIEYCEYKKRVVDSKPTVNQQQESQQEVESEGPESVTSDVSSDDDAGSSDSSTAIETSRRPPSNVEDDTLSLRRTAGRRGAKPFDDSTRLPRKRSKTAEDSVVSSTLSITEIIHTQSRKLEAAVKQFRTDSATARREHHAFLLQKIHDTFPIDLGHGSFLERVAERQSQSLGELFQQLQRQRDAEKIKDEALMHQVFGSTERV